MSLKEFNILNCKKLKKIRSNYMFHIVLYIRVIKSDKDEYSWLNWDILIK